MLLICNLEDLYNTVLNMENAHRKAKALAGGIDQVRRTDDETVRRLPQNKPTKGSDTRNKQQKCPKCTFINRQHQTSCPADGKPCNNCKVLGHFKMSALCQQTSQVCYLSSDEDSQPPRQPQLVHRVGAHNPETTTADNCNHTPLDPASLQQGSEESDSGRGESPPHTNIIHSVKSSPRHIPAQILHVSKIIGGRR